MQNTQSEYIHPLTVNNLFVSYSGPTGNRPPEKGRPVLDNVSFSAEEGSFLLITGLSGCGKSTLASALAGILSHHSPGASIEGDIRYNGKPIGKMDDAERVANVGIVFQNPSNQLFHTYVENAVGFTLTNRGIDRDEVQNRVRAIGEQLHIRHLLDRSTLHLSAGEKQSVVLASVLISEPKVLILDEPSINLDWEAVERFSFLLSSISKQKKITVVLFEHRLPAFFRYCSKFIILNEGKIIFDVPKSRVPEDKEVFRKYGLRYPRKYLQGPPASCIPAGTGFDSKREAGTMDPPLLTVEHVTGGYGKNKVIQDVSFSVFNGDFIAVTGKNGAGKTTLARLITGSKRALRGKIRWRKHLRKLPLGKRVGYVTQEATDQLLFPSVKEEIEYGMDNFRITDEDLRTGLLHSLDVGPFLDRKTSSLSVGQMQRVAIAAGVSTFPFILILDEPSIGQDWRHIEEVMRFLSLFTARGNAVIMITHDDKIVCRFAKRIIHIEDGRISADGKPRLNGKTGEAKRKQRCGEAASGQGGMR